MLPFSTDQKRIGEEIGWLVDSLADCLYNNIEQIFYRIGKEEYPMSEQQKHTDSAQSSPNAAPFNPADHLIHLKGRNGSADYLPVQWRLVWFREVCPQGTIDTEELEVDPDREMEEEVEVWNEETHSNEKIIKRAKGYARYKAIVTDGKGGRATGTKTEKAVSFPDYVEKAETGAIGRALAALGYGTQFTADEFNEQQRIVDAPVVRHTPAQLATKTGNEQRPAVPHERKTASTANTLAADAQPVTETQLASIHKLYERLGKAEPEETARMNYQAAKELIARLSQEYQTLRQNRNKAS
jgi:hypothetical protein